MAPTWDYEHPYPGGPAVAVKGFPRALHAPGTPGYAASVDGDDVEAWKRFVSRLGRWPWQTFDQAYSKAFAHGQAGGNVGDSGVAGVQRQQGWEGSGAIGEKFFNFARNARIPEGLPHAGEPGLDATCVKLLDAAYKRFGGEEPAGGGPVPKLTRKWIASPNYSSRGGAGVRLIVVHTAEGATTIESLGSFFASSSAGVSSHTGIDDKLGVCGEYVKRGNKAWTQGNANPVAVSTELCAFAKWSASQWDDHPNMLENCARWIAEEAAAFDLPITALSDSQAQGSGRGVCQHENLGSWGGGHWDCGGSFPMGDVISRAKELA